MLCSLDPVFYLVFGESLREHVATLQLMCKTSRFKKKFNTQLTLWLLQKSSLAEYLFR